MDKLSIAGTEETPTIILDKQKGNFEFSGRSLTEAPAEFYKPIIKWIEAYSKDPNATTLVMFKLEYINTGSSKSILDVLLAFQQINSAKIAWYFHEDDEDMEEMGEEFSELVEIPFEFLAY